jgi:hypothetical protein
MNWFIFPVRAPGHAERGNETIEPGAQDFAFVYARGRSQDRRERSVRPLPSRRNGEEAGLPEPQRRRTGGAPPVVEEPSV